MDGIQQSMHPSIWSKMKLAVDNRTLTTLTDEQPILLVFMRHFGCSFCREAMADIAKQRKSLEEKGVKVVFVHMADSIDVANKYFKRYKLLPIDHIMDPERQFYQAFGLVRLKPAQLISFMSFVKGFEAAVVKGHGMNTPSTQLGDGFQMPGVFLLYQGKILSSFIHKKEYDRPNYEEIVASCSF